MALSQTRWSVSHSRQMLLDELQRRDYAENTVKAYMRISRSLAAAWALLTLPYSSSAEPVGTTYGVSDPM